MLKGVDWGDLSCNLISLPEGTDFCELLKGLPHDHCQCPHWGFLAEGKLQVDYQDGSQEIVNAGEIYHWPPGHTIKALAATRQIEFSPAGPMGEVLQHVVAKVKAAG